MENVTESRDQPKTTLQAIDVHADWIRQYRTSENDAFYAQAFGFIAQVFGPAGDDPVVDAGCGSAHKAMQLAQRGYRIHGLDFSQVMVDQAKANAASAGLADRMQFSQADLTALTLPSASVRRVYCWGVLMHIPDLPKAVSELSRIVAPGGVLVVSEANWRSIHSWTLRVLRRFFGSRRARIVRTPAGIESWEGTTAGGLLTRQSDIPWLIKEFERHGLVLETRRAGQFSEMYAILGVKPLRKLVHLVNNFWFRYVRAGGPAFANMLVFRRPG